MSSRPERWRSSSAQNQRSRAPSSRAHRAGDVAAARGASCRDACRHRLETRRVVEDRVVEIEQQRLDRCPSQCSTGARHVSGSLARVPETARRSSRPAALLRRDRHQGEADARALREAARLRNVARRAARRRDPRRASRARATASSSRRRDPRGARRCCARLRRAVAARRDGASGREARRARARRAYELFRERGRRQALRGARAPRRRSRAHRARAARDRARARRRAAAARGARRPRRSRGPSRVELHEGAPIFCAETSGAARRACRSASRAARSRCSRAASTRRSPRGRCCAAASTSTTCSATSAAARTSSACCASRRCSPSAGRTASSPHLHAIDFDAGRRRASARTRRRATGRSS